MIISAYKATTSLLFYSGSVFLVRLIGMILIARILMPSDFGQMAIIIATVTFFLILRDFGAEVYLVKLEEDRFRKQHSTIIILNGILNVLILVLSIPFIYYVQPEKSAYIIILFSLNIIGSVFFFQRVILIRQKKMVLLSSIEFIAATTAICVGIIMALNGYGFISIFVLHCFRVFLPTLLHILIVKFQINILSLEWQEIKNIVKKWINFSLFFWPSSVILKVQNSAETLLLGGNFDLTQLGNFNQAKNLSGTPTNIINPLFSWYLAPDLKLILNQKSLPTKVKNDKKIILSNILYISTFIALILSVYSKDLIFFLLGDNWAGTAPLLKIFALTIPFLVLNSFLLILFNLIKKEKIVFKTRFFNFIIFMPILLLILKFNVIEVVAALYVCITFCISIFLILKCPPLYKEFFIRAFFISSLLISVLIITYFVTSISFADHTFIDFVITASAIILAIMALDQKNNIILVILRRFFRWI